MKPRRRKADRCWMLRQMDKVEPYDRIMLICMAAGALVCSITWYNGMNAVAEETVMNSQDIDTLKRQVNQMDGKLDIIIKYVRKND